jgi:hypothetical protein
MTARVRTAIAAAAVGALGIGASAAPASPAAASAGKRFIEQANLFNARYCEILVAKGALPAITVTVWNTIGLNACPAAQWNAFNAKTLATQEGAALVVLNGPRYWVIDAAADTKRGAVRSFGPMRLRDVAAIRITKAADLARKPYETRVIDRTNRWSWKAGRTLYELVAPGGAVYTMQAYSTIVDKTQKLGDLRSLGSRLKLPAGWRFRTRKLGKPYVLQAHGRATIVQDELQNTYQRSR